jgi:hypothetical protein
MTTTGTVHLMPEQEELGQQSQWDFGDLRALFVNCTLKRSPERSHTQGLADISMEIMRRQGVTVDAIRAVDHDIASGVWPDMTDHGWPRDRSGSARHRRSVPASSSGSTATRTCSTMQASTPTTAGWLAAWSPATRTASSTAR